MDYRAKYEKQNNKALKIFFFKKEHGLGEVKEINRSIIEKKVQL